MLDLTLNVASSSCQSKAALGQDAPSWCMPFLCCLMVLPSYSPPPSSSLSSLVVFVILETEPVPWAGGRPVFYHWVSFQMFLFLESLCICVDWDVLVVDLVCWTLPSFRMALSKESSCQATKNCPMLIFWRSDVQRAPIRTSHTSISETRSQNPPSLCCFFEVKTKQKPFWVHHYMSSLNSLYHNHYQTNGWTKKIEFLNQPSEGTNGFRNGFSMPE